MYFKTPIDWPHAMTISLLHCAGLYGLYLAIIGETQVKTVFFNLAMLIPVGFG